MLGIGAAQRKDPWNRSQSSWRGCYDFSLILSRLSPTRKLPQRASSHSSLLLFSDATSASLCPNDSVRVAESFRYYDTLDV